MIVITTPTGDIGHQVLDNILKTAAEGEHIRVIIRDPANLPVHTRDRVEVVQGSHSDHDVVTQVFAGADSVFWLTPPDPHADSVTAAYVDFTRPACEAFKTQSVKRVVIITALGRGTPGDANAGHVTASLAMEDLIASTGVSYRALTMPSFMDNLLNQVEAIKTQGKFFSPISAGRKIPMVATRDIAVVAATLLLDDSWSGQEDVPVLGPEDLSNNDMAQIISEVLAKPTTFQQIPGAAYKARFTGFGMSDAMAQAMLDMAVAKDNGLDNAVIRTAKSSTPTTFRQWCEEVLKPAVLA
jgi:uncharacterized protein YbjT (DUF2867 family)